MIRYVYSIPISMQDIIALVHRIPQKHVQMYTVGIYIIQYDTQDMYTLPHIQYKYIYGPT